MVDLGIGIDKLAAAAISLTVLCLFFGLTSLAAGSITLRRSTALAVAAGIAVVTYLIDAFSVLASWLEPLRPVSPWYWYRRGQPLDNGLDWTGLVILVGICAAALAVPPVVFGRRGLTS